MKYVPTNEALHIENKVTIDQNEKDQSNKEFVTPVNKSAVRSVIRPKTNKKFLGTYLPQYFYLSASQEEDLNTWQRFKKNSLGKEPIYYDSVLVNKSEKNIETYLFNKGYFNSDVTSETTIKNKKSLVAYHLKPNLQWVYGHSKFEQNDSIENYDKLIGWVDLDNYTPKGSAYHVADFKRLREDITEFAYENGFYKFDKNSIFIEPDTLNQRGIVDINIAMEEPEDSLFNQQYRIRDVYIKVGRNSNEKYSEPIEYKNKKYAFGQYSKVKPKVLNRFILLNKDDLYSKSKHQSTIRKLYGLPLINYSTIDFREIKDSLYLDAYITANTKLPIGLKVEPTLSEFEGPAVSLNTSLLHRNAFGGGEFFELSSSIGFESTAGGQGQKSRLFGTQYYDVEPKLTFYRLLGLDKIYPDTYLNTLNQTTSIRLYYGAQRRVGLFNIQETSVGQSWDWQSSKHTRHNLSLVDISFFKVSNISEYFQNIINQQESTRLAYQNRLIFASKYTYSHTNQAKRPDKSYFNVTTTAETAGNLVHLIFGKKDEELEFNNNKVARYVRGILDFKYNVRVPNESMWVNRIYTGVSVPLGSAKGIPAIKQFFSGGNNSLRAWNSRAIGPGSYDYNSSIVNNRGVDLRGDVKLEFNSEYRFPMTKIFGQQLEGAIFTDAGNIWTLDEPENSPRIGTDFSKDFYKEVALDSGVGLRLKIKNFFSVRTDLAFKLHDPALDETNRWVNKPLRFNNSRFSFGIGYPF